MIWAAASFDRLRSSRATPFGTLPGPYVRAFGSRMRMIPKINFALTQPSHEIALSPLSRALECSRTDFRSRAVGHSSRRLFSPPI